MSNIVKEGKVEIVKKNIGFVYISLIVHFYIILIILISFDKDFLVSMFNPVILRPQESEETTIVDTITESETKPLKGVVSDKPNINSAEKLGEDKYNFLNPDMKLSPYQGNNSGKSIVDSSKKNASGEDSIQLERLKGRNTMPLDSGDYHTTYFDPDKPPDVEMDNLGDISLATIPESYAPYFLSMEKKVGEKWQMFFPIFQFYEGIIKSGEVVVSFWVDENGNVINPVVKRSYGYSILDSACVNAIYYSKNFGPLPESIRKNKIIKVDFKFIYTSR